MKIAFNTVTYAVIEIVSKSIPFLLLPYLTNMLLPKEYSLITVYTSLAALFSIFVGFNSQSSIITLYYKDEKNLFNYFSSLFSCWVFSILLLALILLILFFFKLASLTVLLCAMLFAFFWFPLNIYSSILRVKNHLYLYGLL
ncbi:MAG: oligosaccharide flippase family protein, partial [Endozoicomonadaceae bacterium]|nr:oligosaccharide flippase family protein [Endozoicomonadaceae bacterium]